MPFALHSPASEAGSEIVRTYAAAAVTTAGPGGSGTLRTMGRHRVAGVVRRVPNPSPHRRAISRWSERKPLSPRERGLG